MLATLVVTGLGATSALAQTTWTINVNNSFSPVPAGGAAPYGVRITNSQNTASPASTVTFTIPVNTIYNGVTGLSGCTPDPEDVASPTTAPVAVTCDLPVIQPGADVLATVNLQHMVAGSVTLQTSIAGGPSFNRTTTVRLGADLGLALTSAPSPVQAGSDVTITATVTNNGPYPTTSGGQMVLTLPTGLSRNLVLPEECSINADLITCDLPPLAVDGVRTFEFTTQVTASNASTATASGTVASAAPTDPNSNNNSATADIVILEGTDVSLRKTRAPIGLLLVDGDVTFTLQPQVAGRHPEQAQITDIVPDNYSIGTIEYGEGWSCDFNGQAITCDYEAAPGSNYLNPITINAVAIEETGPAGVTNTAVISSPDENAGADANNQANDGIAHIAVPTIDLVAHKSGPPRGLVTVGNTYDFRIWGSNTGDFTNAPLSERITLTDFLPEGLTVTAINTPGNWICEPALPVVGPEPLVCYTDDYVYTDDGVNMPLGVDQATSVITLTAEVTQDGTFRNGVLVSFEDYENRDPYLPDNTRYTGDITSAVLGNWADLGVEKTIVSGSDTVVSGDEITFRIEIFNLGEAVARDVRLVDELIDIVQENGGTPGPIVPATGNGLLCAVPLSSGYSRTLECQIGELPKCTIGDDCPWVEVTVRPGSEGLKENVAVAYSYVTPDHDLDNNVSSVAYTVSPRTDVTVTKATTAEQVGGNVGQEITYVITAQVPDLGLSPAENVTIRDTLPDNVRFIRAVPSVANACGTLPAFNEVVSDAAGNNIVECNFGTLGNLGQETVTIVVVPTMANIDDNAETDDYIVNEVAVSTSTPEIDESNNTDSATVLIRPPALDLEIQKVDLTDPVLIGADTRYRITVINSGPSDATDLIMVDTLPGSGLANPRVVEPLPEGWSCAIDVVNPVPPSGGTVTCTAAVMEAGTSINLEIDMTAVARQRHVNTVTITSNETIAGYDTVPDNNTSQEDTTVRVRSDIAVTKTPGGTGVVDLREEFSWDLTVTALAGDGLDVAEAVVLTDHFPPGMILTDTPPEIVPLGQNRSCAGGEGDSTLICQLDEIAPGDSVTVTVWVKITDIANPGDEMVNTASATTLSFDQDLTNNSDDGTVTRVLGSTIGGTIYRDFNADDELTDGNDTGISNVRVNVSGISRHDGATITAFAYTDANGNYTVSNIPPGTYTVSYVPASVSESHLVTGSALLGTDSTGVDAGTVDNAQTISDVVVTTEQGATDYDFTLIPTARIGLGKVATPQQPDPVDGTYTITYTLSLENFSLEPVENLEIVDLLDAPGRNFGSYSPDAGTPPEGSYTITSVSGGAFGTRNDSFTGQFGNAVLLSGGTLAAGATGTVSYTIHVNPEVPRLNDLTHTNQASVTGTGQYSGQSSLDNPQLTDLSNNTANPDTNNNGIGNEPADNNPTVVTPVFWPSIKLEKTAQLISAGAVPDVGDEIEYTFVVTNTGNTPLVNVVVTDVLEGLSVISGPAQPLRLDLGEHATFTAKYALTQADLDNDSVRNVAEAEGQWGYSPGGGVASVIYDTAVVVTELADPGLTIEKSISSTTITDPRSEVGQTITYTFLVTNTGNTNLRDVVVIDDLLGDDPALVIGALARDASTTVSATYSIDLADINAGQVDNVAFARGTYGLVSAPKTIDSDEDDETQPVYQFPSVLLDKSVDPDSVPDAPRAGDLLTWNVIATNNGNVTLSNLVLSDPIAGATITPASHASVVPGASVSFTVTAPITQAHINAGQVENEASLAFLTPGGDAGTPVQDDETVLLAQLPEIALAKQMITAITDPLVPGDVLRYRFTITNVGNLPLSDITLDDDLPGFVFDAGDEDALQAAVLAPQNAAGTVPLSDTQIVVEGTLTLTQQHINDGEVTNVASTQAYPTVGPVNDPVTDTADVTTSLERDPQIRLIKQVTSVPAGIAQAGDEVTYSFAIHNTGNVVLTDITLSELLIDADVLNPMNWSGPMNPGDIVDDVFTATYRLTQDDINRGYVENSAEVTGTGIGPVGTPVSVSDISGTTVDDDQPTRVQIGSDTGLEILKSELTNLSTPPLEGDSIDYTFVVTNTGNLTLYDVDIIDQLLSATPLHTIAILEPGSDNAFTFGPVSYTVLQSDIQTGSVTNTAVASGIYRDPTTLLDVVISEPSNEIIVPLDQEPGLAVVKEAVFDLNDPTRVGEEIEYYFHVTNTGNIVIDDIVVDDPLPGLPQSSFPVGTLLPGASQTIGPVVYAITQTDIERGDVTNQATASGTYDIGNGPEPISDLSGPTITTDEELVVPLLPVVPGLEIIKTAAFVGGGSSYTLVGDRIEFSFEITNTGNVTVENVRPEEMTFLFGGVPAETPVTDFVPTSVTLPRGDSQTFTASYILTQNDLNAGAGTADGVENTARAVGVAEGTIPVESVPDTATLTLNPQPPSDVDIIKSTTRPLIHRGETVPFMIEVRNNSLANAGRVTIVDRIPSGFVFIEGSATVDGVDVVPTIAGNEISFVDLPLGPLQRIEIGLVLRALPGTPPGRYRNTAVGFDELGTPLAPDAHAFVEIVADAVFDCSDVIGTVFNDLNGNRYQDQGELGIPGVRLSTVRGTLVTTDAFGRFSIPCAAIPDANIGSNFVLKIDTATLPTGFGLTTDNPAMVRLTPGKMVEINFGAQIGRQIRISLNSTAFFPGTSVPTPELQAGINQLISVLAEQDARLHVLYETSGDQGAARAQVGVLVAAIREQWRAIGAPYALVIDTTIEER